MSQKEYVYCVHCFGEQLLKEKCRRQKKGLHKHTLDKHTGLGDCWAWEFCTFDGPPVEAENNEDVENIVAILQDDKVEENK